MPKFALSQNEYADGTIKMYDLVIDGVNQFEAFGNSLEDIYQSELNSCAAYISQVSANRQLPHGKRRKLKGIDNAGEFRTKHLRAYYIILPEYGYTICLLGYKKNQDKDLKHLKIVQKSVLTEIKENGTIEIK